MKKSLIQLIGEPIDLQDLKNALHTSEWKIVEETDGYYITSETIDRITDIREIYSKVQQFLDILNGATNLFHGDHRNVKMGSLLKIDENGHRSIFMKVNESIRLRDRVTATLKNKNDITDYPTTIEVWLNKAEKYESIRDALHFFNEITWWNLYKIFEIISADQGGQNGLLKFIKKSDLTHFTQASQSRELLGDYARHANTRKYPAPKKAMTLDEAYGIIKNLFENWINTKN